MIEQIKLKAQDIVREAGKLFLDLAENKTIVTKDGTSNFATFVDYRVQEYMIKELNSLIPGCNIITEESVSNVYKMDIPTWILDPVDGTINISHDFKHSAISLALFIDKKPQIGIIYNPYSNEMFRALSGNGAYINDKQICTSTIENMKDSLILFGTTPYDRSKSKKTFSMVEKVFLNCQDIRRSGSAALDIAYTACGRIEGFFELCLQPWDYAAGMIILSEAGGRLTNWEGEDLNALSSSSILATNGLIHKSLMEILNELK